ncbi:ABC transporter ATP-binding protein [Chelatococcus asaccharovorans]|uniref:Branched-chain amino acid transport system ATP-binding protein n=1 Tax=Chelatococcus asaccharovorans TaxID=28210 RepID=A0A2V3TQY9_9HYPH|nr:ABC transporter ATP-binding protein [Chelatococcus asaccharovorans]MBS7707829.1 ABC transporter ATP-binding protein [Chelatococcus asaccharovorans]PXW50924.1 branched-chain amino acid transport system ATP-binding protein [Chelatococcus asaccharovorans]
MNEALLKLDKVSAFYGNLKAVDEVDLAIRPGELMCVIGPNGAGKTSLLKAISRTLTTVSGTVTFLGQPTNRASAQQLVSKGLIHVPEGRQVFAMMSVEENLRVGGYARRDQDLGSDLETVFNLFPRLRERRSQMAISLSGGEQQMLAIGRALMGRPKVLMLDEPSMGLAPVIIKEIYKEIRRLKETGITILLVEQNAKLALDVADHALIISAGRTRFAGPAEVVRRDRSAQSLIFGH